MVVTRREQQIIDAYEAGLRVGQIAAQLGLSYITVKGIIRNLCLNIGPDRDHQQRMREGSRALLNAIKRARRA